MTAAGSLVRSLSLSLICIAKNGQCFDVVIGSKLPGIEVHPSLIAAGSQFSTTQPPIKSPNLYSPISLPLPLLLLPSFITLSPRDIMKIDPVRGQDVARERLKFKLSRIIRHSLKKKATVTEYHIFHNHYHIVAGG
jgi:hypothetical protein